MESQKFNCQDLKPIEKRNAGTAYRIEGTRHSLIPTRVKNKNDAFLKSIPEMLPVAFLLK
jgi:hypothetical protein